MLTGVLKLCKSFITSVLVKRLCFEELCNVNVTLVIFSVVRVDVWVCVEKENALYPYHLKVCTFIAHGKEKVGISPNYNFQKLN